MRLLRTLRLVDSTAPRRAQAAAHYVERGAPRAYNPR
jgi:hypothetical protein